VTHDNHVVIAFHAHIVKSMAVTWDFRQITRQAWICRR
jgi:hypothetical protein